MAQKTMYLAKAGSPYTTTTGAIGVSDTSIPVAELSVLPTAPGICMIYVSSTQWERCVYSEKSNTSGSGTITVTRSGDGHASTDGSNGPLTFEAGARVLRNVTSWDHDVFKNNIEDHETRVSAAESTISGHTSDISGKAASSHVHGNITTDGKIGSTANLPLITTTAGAVTAGSFGTGANSFCQGNDSRLSDDRNPAISAMTAESVIVDEDYIPVYDASTSANRKSTAGNLFGSMLNVLTRSIILLGSTSEVPSTNGGASDTATMGTNGQIIAGTKFAAGATDLSAQWRFRLPNNYAVASGFKYKVGFLLKTASAASTNVIFGLQALIVGNGGTIDTAWGTAVELTTDVSSLAANVFKITAESGTLTPALAPSNLTVTGGEEIIFRIYRKGSDTSATDVLLTDVYLTYTTDNYEDA